MGSAGNNSQKGLFIALAVLAGVAGLAFVVFFILGPTVHVDNYSPSDLAVEMDGKPWLTVGTRSTQQKRLPRGTHEVVVKDAKTGEQADKMTVTVDSGGPYILNLLGATTYLRGQKSYAKVAVGMAAGDPAPTIINDKWFQASVDYLFEMPPNSIKVSKGTMSATRTFLVRGGL